MDKEEQNFALMLSPLRELKPGRGPLERLLVTPRTITRSHMWWYTFSPIVAVMVIFLIKTAQPAELDTASDMVAMINESEEIGRAVNIDLMALEDDNVNKLGL